MSPRAAWRLEALGFGPVYDYTTGKVDWLAAGRPTDGSGSQQRRVLDVLDPPPLTCTPTASLASVAARMRGHGAELCVVVNEQQIVQGRLRLDKLPESPSGLVEAAMEPGPPTIRANDELDATRQRMAARGVRSLIVTTPEGFLLGVVRRDEPT